MSDRNRLQIRLPEGVEFSLPLAGPITRFFAWIIDVLTISVTTTVIGTISLFMRWLSPDFMTALAFICYFVVTLGYYIFLEWLLRGQTIGKKVLKLRVIDASGMRLKFGQVLVRNLLRFVDMLPGLYLLGGTICLLSAKCQRLGDLAANTIVVRQSAPPRPDLEKLMEGKFNSLRAHPHLAARFRQKLDPAQASLMLRALLRRDQLEPDSRLKFFSDASAELQKMVPLPDELKEALSDEAHVRNVVDVVYRPRVGKAG